jgi:TolB-like protein
MRTTLQALYGLLLLASTQAVAQEKPAGRFAVLPLENSGSYGQDKEVFEALELGLAAMLARALDRAPGADAVPQERVAEAIRSHAAGPSRRIDAASAAQVAKGLGARWAVTGTFADFYGKFRLNARLVDAESGQIVKVISNDDPKQQDRAQLAGIVQAAADRLIVAAGLPAGGPGTAAAPVPTDAITAYSRGLLHESRGDRAGAAGFYRQAISAFGGFDEAKAGLARTEGR